MRFTQPAARANRRRRRLSASRASPTPTRRAGGEQGWVRGAPRLGRSRILPAGTARPRAAAEKPLAVPRFRASRRGAAQAGSGARRAVPRPLRLPRRPHAGRGPAEPPGAPISGGDGGGVPGGRAGGRGALPCPAPPHPRPPPHLPQLLLDLAGFVDDGAPHGVFYRLHLRVHGFQSQDLLPARLLVDLHGGGLGSAAPSRRSLRRQPGTPRGPPRRAAQRLFPGAPAARRHPARGAPRRRHEAVHGRHGCSARRNDTAAEDRCVPRSKPEVVGMRASERCAQKQCRAAGAVTRTRSILPCPDPRKLNRDRYG